MPTRKEPSPPADVRGAIRNMPARVKYIVNIYEGKTLIDRHELENPTIPINKGDGITLWNDGLKDLVVASVSHKFDREITWLTQTVDVYCVVRGS